MRYVAIALLCLVSSAEARWKPEYASASQETRDWFESRELTLAAQQRFHFKSCCNNADRVMTEFRVSKNAGVDEWWYLTSEKTWKKIPADIIHWDEHSPNGEAVLFAIGTSETCFFPPSGGL